MAYTLTPYKIEEKILEVLKDHWKKHRAGLGPTTKEIAEELHTRYNLPVTVDTLRYHLTKLKRNGVIDCKLKKAVHHWPERGSRVYEWFTRGKGTLE